MNDCTCSDPVETRPMFCTVHGPEDIVGNPTPIVWIEVSKLATLERDLAACRAALRELVACKDLHDRIEAGGSLQDGTLAMDGLDYRRRKPLAWAAARAILQSDEGETK